MKKIAIIINLVIWLYQVGFAQKITFDIASFSPPVGWERSEDTGLISYNTVDGVSGTLCFLTIYNSQDGSGNADTNFKQQWNAKMVTSFGLTSHPDMQKGTQVEGWDIRLALDTFSKNGATYIALLTVMSGYHKTFDILAITNDKKYFASLDTFYKSIELQKSATTGAVGNTTSPANIVDATGGLYGSKRELWGNCLLTRTAAIVDEQKK